MVCVVFLDEAGAVFNPTWVRSHFIHCYIVVQHVTGARCQPLYKVCVHIHLLNRYIHVQLMHDAYVAV